MQSDALVTCIARDFAKFTKLSVVKPVNVVLLNVSGSAIVVSYLRLVSAITAFAFLGGPAHAQSSPAARFETFLSAVSADSDRALESLFAGSNVAQAKPLAWTEMKAQTRSVLATYGKPLGFEKINERDFTPSLKRLTYLQKFDAYPVVWHVLFYRAKDEWVANSVVVSDNVGLMLLGL